MPRGKYMPRQGTGAPKAKRKSKPRGKSPQPRSKRKTSSAPLGGVRDQADALVRRARDLLG